MTVSPEIQELVDDAVETLHVELKGWLAALTIQARSALNEPALAIGVDIRYRSTPENFSADSARVASRIGARTPGRMRLRSDSRW
jgi:hypothetical protein